MTARRITQPTLGPMEVKTVNRERLTPVNSDNREREWLGLIGRAAGKALLSHDQLAGCLGISAPHLSAQLSAVESKHFSYRRMWKLPPEFWGELVTLICEFHDITIGQSVQERTDGEIGRLVREAVQKAVAR